MKIENTYDAHRLTIIPEDEYLFFSCCVKMNLIILFYMTLKYDNYHREIKVCCVLMRLCFARFFYLLKERIVSESKSYHTAR